MGLDMYIYEAHKPSAERTRNAVYREDLASFTFTEVDEMVENILPLCAERELIARYLDIEKIKEVNGISKDARVCGSAYYSTFRKWDFKDGDEIKTVSYTEDELKNFIIEKKENVYGVFIDEIWYGRKEYEVQHAIHKMFNAEGIIVENCGYYRLTESMVERLNDEYGLGLPMQDNLVYHEWY